MFLKNNYPNYWNMIYYRKRSILKLWKLIIMTNADLDQCPHSWFGKRSKVFSVDQTYDSLEMLKKRQLKN